MKRKRNSEVAKKIKHLHRLGVDDVQLAARFHNHPVTVAKWRRGLSMPTFVETVFLSNLYQIYLKKLQRKN